VCTHAHMCAQPFRPKHVVENYRINCCVMTGFVLILIVKTQQGWIILKQHGEDQRLGQLCYPRRMSNHKTIRCDLDLVVCSLSDVYTNAGLFY